MMAKTCGECGGSGKYVGLIVEEPCSTCGGSGVRAEDSRSTLTCTAVDREKKEITFDVREGPIDVKNDAQYAEWKLNTWLRKWADDFGDDEIWQKMSRVGVLGLRLSRELMRRLGQEFQGTHSIRTCPQEWTSQGLTFKILPPIREDWDPEIVIRLTNGEKPCGSEKESPAYCSTLPLRRAVGEAQMKAEADLEREVSRIHWLTS